MLVYNNRVPSSEAVRMQAPYQEGSFPFPVKYGYVSVGVVEHGPAMLQGQSVFCLFPHQSHFVVPASAVTPIPAHIPAARAVLAANMETAINALWDAQPGIGDKITIIGAGVVGCLVAYLASRIKGCEVELIDINESRQETATQLGVIFRNPDTASPDRDLVIHASATANGLNTALGIAGMEATVLELSWFGTEAVSLNLGASFHSRRLQIRCSQVGQIAVNQRSRWSYQRRIDLALSLLDDPMLDCLISGESRFDELPQTMQQLAKPGTDTLCHRIRYN